MERPRRRADLEEGRAPSGEVEALHDPVLGRRIELGPVARRLVAALDGVRSTDEVLLAVSAAGVPRSTVEASFRSLLLLHVLEGTGGEVLERARRASTEPPPLVFLPGTRFQCQGSGACCQGYAFGPLTAADRERLASHDLAGAGLGDGPHVEERAGEWFLATTKDGRCTFLRDDARCGVHAAFGAAAKPALCQLYPIRAFATLEGVKVYDGGECASFATSARSGPPLEADRERIRALLPERPPVEHPAVFVGELAWDMGYLLAIQRVAAERLAAPHSARGALRAVLALLERAVSALASCPLAAGEPERVLDQALEGALSSTEECAPATPRDASALARVLDDLLAAFGREGASAATLVEILATALHLAASAADPLLVLAHDHASVARVSAEGPDVDEPLRLALRSAVWGDQLLVEKRLLAGVARLATSHFLVLTGARLRAFKDRSPCVRAQDVSFAQSTVLRLLRRPAATAVFTRHEADAWALARACTQGT